MILAFENRVGNGVKHCKIIESNRPNQGETCQVPIRKHVIGYFALRDGRVVTDPLDHSTLVNLREINVITMVQGELRMFTPD